MPQTPKIAYMATATIPTVTEHATGALIGYGRVSTDAQNTALQLAALNAAGCLKVFEEKASARSRDGRPQLAAALEYARPGDTIVCWKVDRIARSVVDLITIVDDLAKRGIGFKVLTGALAGIDTTTPDGRLFLTIIGGMAEFERSLIQERTREGLDAARAAGRVGGRPSVVTGDVLAAVKARQAKGESVPEIARALGIGKSSLYRALAAEAEAEASAAQAL